MIHRALSPKTRRALVKAKIVAMQGGADAGLRIIDEERHGTAGQRLESLALAIGRAEIMYLDARDREASAYFQAEVEPHLSALPPEAAILVAENLTLISDALLDDDSGRFYHLVDQRRLLDLPIRDFQGLAAAADAVERGDHFEALPIYWQQLLRAYENMSWRAARLAERDLARECMALEMLNDSAYYAMLAMSESVMRKVGERAECCRSTDVVRVVLNAVLGCSELKKHASLVARLIGQVADAIPDDLVGPVREWLLKRATFAPTPSGHPPLLEGIWTSVAKLAPRFSQNEADQMVSAAIQHPLFLPQSIHRRHLLRAVNACVHLASPSRLEPIAEAVMPAATIEKNDVDYVDAINVLCHVASSADESLKRTLMIRLYPPSPSPIDSVLLHVGPVFGWSSTREQSYDENGLKIAEGIRKQVERLAPGDEPTALPGFGIVSANVDGGRLVVHVGGAQMYLDAIIEHRDRLSAAVVIELAEAILLAIGNDDNIITNRISLVQSIGTLADRLPNEIVNRVVAQLEPMAIGAINESRAVMPYARATNPLNPFKMNLGDPAQLRGAALLSLAEIEVAHPDLPQHLHDDLLLQGMSDPNGKVRALAFVAARECLELTDIEKTAAMLGSMDPEFEAARCALSVFTDPNRHRFNEGLWLLMLRCLEAASTSIHTSVRRVAAKVSKSALAASPPSSVAERIVKVNQSLGSDVCFSVRLASGAAS